MTTSPTTDYMLATNGSLTTDRAVATTLVDILRQRVTQHGEKRLYTLLVDGEYEEQSLSYAELDRQARAIAARLQAMGAAGQRALLLYPPGLEYIAGFFGCLYAGVIAVPAYPPNPARLARTLPRIQTMVQNAQATIALTTEAILTLAPMVFQQAPDLAALTWLATDTQRADAELAWHAPAIDTNTLAFLQYTSGSTGIPKGVMLSHANLLANELLIHEAFATQPTDMGVSWLPPYHDMGLIGGILQPVYFGGSCVLMSPVTFLQRPLRWLQAITRFGGTISGGPNFAYDLCARKATPEQIATLDLSRWSLAFTGAEPVRPETIERFSSTFAPAGFRREAFYPCYGLAEATLIVTGVQRGHGPAYLTLRTADLEQDRVVLAAPGETAISRLAGSGHARHAAEVQIVDPQTQAACPPDRIGEIWVRGPSNAQGYWQRPDDSTATFQARLASGDGPFMRTGDLGFLHAGELYVTGRLKDLIIIDGRNSYPQDIEQTVEAAHAAIRPGCSAAFSVDIDGQERLVVVAEVERSFVSAQRRGASGEPPQTRQAVVTAVRRAVSEAHDLRVHDVVLLKTGTIPKTSSGKIQRHACRNAYRDGSLEVLED